uniref:Uncharacterized protein LOC113794525 n=1 Tax=Dermatophagoides pteronyssinus TaxID=6956 RepID=A0A6P6Y616_DERPT|nr:uncharacterized protein LOC113794525 [Dermatophagoides pteronyssinus]
MEPVTHEFNLGSSERSLLAAAVLFGNLFGSPIGGMLSDRIGRKSTLMITWMALIVTMLSEAASTYYYLLFTCRMLIAPLIFIYPGKIFPSSVKGTMRWKVQ